MACAIVASQFAHRLLSCIDSRRVLRKAEIRSALTEVTGHKKTRYLGRYWEENSIGFFLLYPKNFESVQRGYTYGIFCKTV